jgi:hypothetical protein
LAQRLRFLLVPDEVLCARAISRLRFVRLDGDLLDLDLDVGKVLSAWTTCDVGWSIKL